LVNTLKVKNLLVIGDASFYGNGLAQVVAADAKTDGATVTTQTLTNVNSGGGGTASEYAPAATTIAGNNPDGIFYGGYAADFGLLLGALSQAGYSAAKHPIMSGDGSNETALLTATSPSTAANGVYLSQSAAGAVNYFTGTLATAYQKLTGQKASAAEYAAQAYDATNAFVKALEAATRTGSLTAIRQSVTAHLRTISFKGVTGTISFSPSGNLKVDSGSVAVSQVQNGAIVAVTTVQK
jgi:branched-chain amino acid transport system substrate-binding protein